MPNAHAILGPSASGRWINCPGSVRMTRDIPSHVDSVYAREGTQFHTLGELTAEHLLRGGSARDYMFAFLDWGLDTEEEWVEDQLMYVKGYIEFLQKCLDEEPGARLLLEQKVDTGIPGCWGTADAIVIYSDRIRVVDIKYGQGQRVSALGNSQLRLYGVGALTLVDDPLAIHVVQTTIWQPRLQNVSDEVLTRKELEAWRDDLIPVAKLALGEDAPFGPSETACRWCLVSGSCAPRATYMLDQDFGNPNLLTGQQMADIVTKASDMKRWIADVEDAALKQAYETDGSVPGFKVVMSGGRRSIKDDDAAIAALLAAGYGPDQVSTRKIATLGQLDKLVGAEKLQYLLDGVLVKSEGRLSLAPEGDPRPPADALHSAKTDFADIAEGEA